MMDKDFLQGLPALELVKLLHEARRNDPDLVNDVLLVLREQEKKTKQAIHVSLIETDAVYEFVVMLFGKGGARIVIDKKDNNQIVIGKLHLLIRRLAEL